LHARESSVKRIALTGCTRGLGRALVQCFNDAGAHVVGCGRSSDELKELGATFCAPHHFSKVDVSDDPAVRRWSRKVIAEFGAPDLLINNAAVIAPNAPLWKVSAQDFAQVLEVNIGGVANSIRHFVPAMIARGSGVIVNISSGWGRSTSPEVAAYCASKWAIEGLTQALAQELPAGLAAVAVNPGITDTDMLRRCFGKSAAHYPGPDEWVKRAGPFLLRLGPGDNGRSLDVPGVPLD
jgi:NAD(P)-dependent dehydrogenase (short-subunit alcohol dehydrogenase family)